MEQTSGLGDSLIKLSQLTGKLKKNKRHAGLGYRYAELSQVLEMLGPILVEQEKFVTFDIHYAMVGDQPRMILTGVLRDKNNNELMRSDVPLIGVEGATNARNSPMQNLGSAITYARRYCLLNMFNLCAEDDDGEQGIIRENGYSAHGDRAGYSVNIQPRGRAYGGKERKGGQENDLCGEFADDSSGGGDGAYGRLDA